jgi:hypothetical protein
MSVAQWRGIGRAVIGVGFVVVGVVRQISSTSYPAGDWRGDPTISTIVNGGIVVVGVHLILSAAIPFIRGSRPRS